MILNNDCDVNQFLTLRSTIIKLKGCYMMVSEIQSPSTTTLKKMKWNFNFVVILIV